MTKKNYLAAGFAVGHLLLVVCGAASISVVPPACPGWKALRCYGALSGADDGYGFFAPSVAFQRRIALIITDSTGASRTEYLDEGENREVALRVGGVVDTLPLADSHAKWRRSMAASWAASMFGRHSDANEILVRVEEYQLPAMVEYKAGERPAWRVMYEARFVRDRDQEFERRK